MTRKFILKYSWIAITIAVCTIAYLSGDDKSDGIKAKILSDPFLSVATLIRIKRAYKRSDSFIYIFIDKNNSLITSSGSSDLRNKYNSYEQFLGKTFPIISNKENPTEFNQILITKADFDYMGIPFPDSLKWVEDLP